PKLAQMVDKAAKRRIIKSNAANRIKSRFALAIRKARQK
ncbi:30S ribosomal protein S20, partial [Candidatus Uhrbacteria bacterium]|nr:30S ribosomal protein S20 [Candidatus Uhrbacteria bacterium]